MNNVPNYYEIKVSLTLYTVNDDFNGVRNFIKSLEETIDKHIAENTIKNTVRKTINITSFG